MTNRIYNFNPGPAALPISVLEEIQASFLDFQGSDQCRRRGYPSAGELQCRCSNAVLCVQDSLRSDGDPGSVGGFLGYREFITAFLKLEAYDEK